jgi:hypothetical protein
MMTLPKQSAPVARNVSTHPIAGALTPSGCNFVKKALCASALAACAAVCVGSGGAACVQCLGALGMSSCIDCV